LIARILLSVLMIPLLMLIYLITLMMAWSRFGLFSNRDLHFIVAGVVTWICAAIYWMLVWYRSVRWTNARVTHTIFAAVGALVVGWLAGLSVLWVDDEFGDFVASVTAPLVWLICTVLIWRESAEERAERLRSGGRTIVCPTCGYNLTGLTGTRCPECGTQLTLDELMASQPSRAEVEVE
jgi:hypothetical protein